MHAVILAAGIGRRLAAHAGDGPKCLLRFGGATLLDRQLRMLAEAGVERLTLACGHGAARVERTLAEAAPRFAAATVFNPDFRRGSVLSLLAAAPALEAGEDLVLMDADVLCDTRMMQRLVTSPHANCLLLDRDLGPGDEPVKLALMAGRPVALGKQLADDAVYDTIGESVGFFRLAPAMAACLARQCRAYRDRGAIDAPHEDALRDLLLAWPTAFGYEDVSGLPWIEIDYPEDMARANERVLPKLCNPRNPR